MAITNNLPPQAYTRDTLVKAIEWLSSQPASLRERASSADLIVSHYLQARRRASGQEQENFKADLKSMAQEIKKQEQSAPPQPPNRSFDHGPGSERFAQPMPLRPEPHPRFQEQLQLQLQLRPEPAPPSAPVSQPQPPPPPQPLQTVMMQPMMSPPVHQQQMQQHTHPQQQILQPQPPPPIQQPQPQPHPQPQAPPPMSQPPPIQHHEVRQNDMTLRSATWHVDARSLAIARDLMQRLNLSSEAEAFRMLVSLGAERARDLLP